MYDSKDEFVANGESGPLNISNIALQELPNVLPHQHIILLLIGFCGLVVHAVNTLALGVAELTVSFALAVIFQTVGLLASATFCGLQFFLRPNRVACVRAVGTSTILPTALAFRVANTVLRFASRLRAITLDFLLQLFL